MKVWVLNVGIAVTMLTTAWMVYTKPEEKEVSLFSYDQPSISVQKQSTDFEKALKAFLTQHGYQEVTVLNDYAEAQVLVLLPLEHLSSHKKREIQQMVNQIAKQYHVNPDVVNVQLYEKE
ncbi:hypothetical protein M3225_10030 [Priestia aryabhattai]|uniref:hypothetical protein n=1 Tax=Priestia aryabhattai TaxID=412384 RepID=UPI00203DAC57|nr:hypothetical protein [Priestia aryabhattai]MCM3770831.1 hypothetical protein [Priestia aryabhattai]